MNLRRFFPCLLDSLCETLPSVQSELATLVAEIEKERASLSSLEGKKVAAEDYEKCGRGMESDVRKMDDCLFELKEIDRKVRQTLFLHGDAGDFVHSTVKTVIRIFSYSGIIVAV